MIKKKIAILGATGSVGTQALMVIKSFPELFKATILTADSNADLLIKQAVVFRPEQVVITNSVCFDKVHAALSPLGIAVLTGQEALCEVVQHPEVDIVLTALVGFVGVKPTLAAIRAKKNIALANKETLVVAGSLIMNEAKINGVEILPVDSEHSAIFQCLLGEQSSAVEKLILTASGGPFRGKDRRFLSSVTPEQALRHPTWEMGKKISIDSASLMNKGLEVIEAYWLFGVKVSQIDVIIHPQSVIHSMVQFKDGSIKAQMGVPDMKLPIQIALSHPSRLENSYERFDFLDYPTLSFERPDEKVFVNLALAYRALNLGGVVPAALNAANEVVVAAFLKGQIGFLEMSDIVGETMENTKTIEAPGLEDFFETDRQSRIFAKEMIQHKSIFFHNKR